MLTAQVLVYIIMAFLMGFLTGMLSVIYHPRTQIAPRPLITNDHFYISKDSILRFWEPTELIQSLTDFAPIEQDEESIDIIAFLQDWARHEAYDGE